MRELGGGDYRRGMIMMMEAAAEVGCQDLWVATANYKPRLPGYFVFDRFRTDVTWTEQLAATERFLHSLAPAARDLGCHLNLETHEEITSFELAAAGRGGGAGRPGHHLRHRQRHRAR